MKKSLSKIQKGYLKFREKYASGDQSIMDYLSSHGQNPEIMVVACCDSRVDPALILQSDPGELFVVRNVANIIPPYEKDDAHHGTSAALEFGVRILKIKHLIIVGHSQCNGIKILLNSDNAPVNDFISNWVSTIKYDSDEKCEQDEFAKQALQQSYKNCMTFPWLLERVEHGELIVHLWFFDIKTGQILSYSAVDQAYFPLEDQFR